MYLLKYSCSMIVILKFIACGCDCQVDLCVCSVEHDKPFCIKAITMVNNFKKALGNTVNC